MVKAMAIHSSTLVWKIPWKEEPGRLQSMGSLRVGTDCQMSGWMNDKLELMLPREIPTISDIEMITVYWQKVKFQ